MTYLKLLALVFLSAVLMKETYTQDTNPSAVVHENNADQQVVEEEEMIQEVSDDGSVQITPQGSAANDFESFINWMKEDPYKIGDVIKGVAEGGRTYESIKLEPTDKHFMFFEISIDNQISQEELQTLELNIQRYTTTLEDIGSCGATARQSCYVPTAVFKDSQFILLSFDCQGKCEYQIKTKLSDAQQLLVGTTVLKNLEGSNQALFRVSLDSTKFSEFRLVAKAFSQIKTLETARIYLSFGEVEPTSKKYDVKSVSLWEDGEAIFLRFEDIKQPVFNILLVGQQEMTYEIACQVIQKDHLDLQIHQIVHQFLKANEQKVYHAKFTEKAEQYVIRFSAFMGNTQFNLYTDAKCTNAYSSTPLNHMMDLQYLIDQNDVSKHQMTGIYIKIRANSRSAVFSLRYSSRSSNAAVVVSQNIYQFISLQAPRTAIYQLNLPDIDQTQRLTLELDANLYDLRGITNVKFYLCREQDSAQCDTLNNLQPLNFNRRSVIGKKSIYSLTIPLIQQNQKQQLEYLIMMLQPNTHLIKPQQQQSTMVAIDVLDKNRTIYLRQNKMVQEHIDKGQIKYYKFTNSDPTIINIRAHVNTISGNVFYEAAHHNVQSLQQQLISLNPTSKIIDLNTSITQPIFITVMGLQPSLYTISITVNHPTAAHLNSYLISTEQVPFRFQLGPGKSQILELKDTIGSEKVTFDFRATSMVSHCVLNNKFKCATKSPQFSDRSTLLMKPNPKQNHFIKFHNPHHKRSLQVDAIFLKGTGDRCITKSLNRLHPLEHFKKGSCLTFHIQKNRPIELALFVSRDRNDYTLSLELCQQFIGLKKDDIYVTIEHKDVVKACQNDKARHLRLYIARHDKTVKQHQLIGLSYAVRYTSDSLQLPVSTPFIVRGSGTSTPLDFLHMRILNKMDTTIAIEAVKGQVQVFAKIMSYSDLARIDQQSPRQTFTLSLIQQKDYFDSPYIFISKNDIINTVCIDCVIMMAIYSLSPGHKQIQASVQFLQGSIKLNDGVSHQNYVAKDETLYFSFINIIDKSVLRILISDNDNDCAVLFIDKNNEHPSPKKNMRSSQDNQVLMPADKGIYFIAVHGIQNCPFHIAVSHFTMNVAQLGRGVMAQVSLAPGQVSYFLYHHHSEEAFKIYSLTKFGEVQIYLNKSSIFMYDHTVGNALQKVSFADFGAQSYYNNIMEIDKNHGLFQHTCDYLIAVRALKLTKTSISVVQQSDHVKISNNKAFSDYLKNVGQTTRAVFHDRDCPVGVINVFTGQLHIQYSYKDQKANINASPSRDATRYQFTCDKDNQIDWNIKFVFKAMKPNTRFTFQMIPKIVYPDKYPIITPGAPQFCKLTETNSNCYTGTLRDDKQQIFISVHQSDISKLFQIRFTLKVNKVDYRNHTSNNDRNIIHLRFPKIRVQQFGSGYQLCFYLDNTTPDNKNVVITKQDDDVASIPLSLPVSIYQVDDLNILIKHHFFSFNGTKRFIVHAVQPFFLDILSCQGSYKMKKLFTVDQNSSNVDLSHLLQNAGSGHVLLINSSDTTFFEIQGQGQIIKWIPINQDKDIGVGYLKYSIGDLHYTFTFGHVQIQFVPIFNFLHSNAKVVNVTYRIIYSASLDDVEQASHCSIRYEHSFNHTSQLVLFSQTSVPSQLTKRNITIDKNQMIKQLQGIKNRPNLYFTIIGDLVLLPPNLKDQPMNHEYYRFTYKRLQVPMQQLKPNSLEAVTENVYLIILATLLVIAAAFILTCLLTRKIIPTVMKYMSRQNLVEDEAGVNQAVPQSSDRSPVTSTLGVVTTENVVLPPNLNQPQ